MPAIGKDQIETLVDDRAAAGVFRVGREAFVNFAVYEEELRRIFEGTWIYIGLESQVRNPNAYFTTMVGRQSILVMRGSDGRLGAFFNSCPHRGTQVCPWKAGTAKIHVCQYHGWTFDSSGRNLGVAHQDIGQYPPAFSAMDHGLVPVARFGNYRGLLFVSLSPDVPTLDDHLGEARRFIDLVVDQAPDGLEYVPGSVGYTFDGNWKLQFENGLDYYHFETVHRSFVDVLQRRGRAGQGHSPRPDLSDPEPPAQGTFSFDHGHAIMWSIGVPGQGPEARPFARDGAAFAAAAARHDRSRLQWMLRHRNLTIFPNLQIIDIQSLQFRTWRPLGVGKTEMQSHCVGPIGESVQARRFRIRQYEEFFNPSGLATSDDNVIYEYCQDGLVDLGAGDTQGHLRGLGDRLPAGINYGPSLGLSADIPWTYGPAGFGDETAFHSGWREWRRLMLREPA
jgi:benzoate/toluate 1,2-dioxygenase alpha subunit/2,4,5-trichlorophenoxyacetic acid oxygenase 1